MGLLKLLTKLFGGGKGDRGYGGTERKEEHSEKKGERKFSFSGDGELGRNASSGDAASVTRKRNPATRKKKQPQVPKDIGYLAQMLGVDQRELLHVRVRYKRYEISKRNGGRRVILAPENDLKRMQERVLKRILRPLRTHPSAMAFERGKSIVHNAQIHLGQAIVVGADLRDFFTSTSRQRIVEMFERLGWQPDAVNELIRLCTYEQALPQGAVTSPRLSNLVNYAMDVRLAALANHCWARYSRYADDLTFSFAEDKKGANEIISIAKAIVADYGYKMHGRKKQYLARRHQQQRVTGLVINDRVNLPRKTRRWLRAVEHRLKTGGPATLTAEQLAGWRSFEQMVRNQSQAP